MVATRPRASANPTDEASSPDSFEQLGVETIDEQTGEALPADLTNDNESDDDVSVTEVPPPGETDGSQGSLDIIPLSMADRAGKMKADDDMCRVILAAKNPEGQTLFCGNPALLCKRRTHQAKQLDPTNRADPGVYEGVLSSNRKNSPHPLTALAKYKCKSGDKASETLLLPYLDPSLLRQAQTRRIGRPLPLPSHIQIILYSQRLSRGWLYLWSRDSTGC
jgi:hypothetical protein